MKRYFIIIMSVNELEKEHKAISKQLFAHLKALDAQVQYLKNGLHDFLEEPDVKEMPSYDLLRSVYQEYLICTPESVPSTSSDKSDPNDQYDPLFAPPSSRKRINREARKMYDNTQAEINVRKKQTESQPRPRQKQIVFADSQTFSDGPDFGSDMLGPDPGTKSETKPNILKITADKNAKVYRVEIQGTEYLRYDKHLYDKDSHLRVGSIEATCFNIHGKAPITIDGQMKLSALDDTDMYRGTDDKVYMRVNDGICHAIGQMQGEEIGLWG